MVRENRGIKERNEERWVREGLLLLPFPERRRKGRYSYYLQRELCTLM